MTDDAGVWSHRWHVEYKPTRKQRRCRHAWILISRDVITQRETNKCRRCDLIETDGGLFNFHFGDILEALPDADRRS